MSLPPRTIISACKASGIADLFRHKDGFHSSRQPHAGRQSQLHVEQVGFLMTASTKCLGPLSENVVTGATAGGQKQPTKSGPS